MKYLIHLILSLISVASIAQTTNPSSIPDFDRKFNERSSTLLQECVTFKETVGISAGIYKDGKISWSDAAGLMDTEKNTPANVDMINRTASISKPMTAVAILQLMEKGLLQLDDPIQKYIPDFPVKKEGTITIKHLLNHSSGVKAYKNGKEGFPTKNYPTLRDAIKVFEDRSLANRPGEGYQYTTYGYVILGEIIEQVSGQSYRSYMKEHIWDKAGMTNTDVEIFGTTYTNKSKLYRGNGKGGFKNDKITNLSLKVPGGGIQSTVPDLLNFAAAILNNTLIKAETLQLMATDTGIKKQGNPYGLGWFLYSSADKPSGRIIGHSGAQSGTATQLFIFLDKKAAVVVLSNTGDAWNNVFTLTDKLSDAIVRPEDVNKEIKKVVTLPKEILDNYTGKYVLEGGSIVELKRKGNNLYGNIDNQGDATIFASSNTDLFLRVQDIQLKFASANKKASQFELTIYGNKMTATRK